MSRRRAAAALFAATLALGAAPAAAQDPAVVPAEPIPVPADPLAADSLAAGEVLEAPPFVPPATAKEKGSPWLVEWPGFRGLTLWRYERVDGLVPAFGVELAPVDPDRTPEVAARIGAATTRAKAYWELRARQRLPLAGAVHVEAAWVHRPATFDGWKLTPRENDFATFLVGSDQMDWWRERGFELGLAWESSGGAVQAGLAGLVLEQWSEPSRDPFALVGDGDEYRPNPAVAEGDLHALRAGARYDGRDVQSPLLPAPGWILALELEAAGDALGGDVDFRRGFLDVRRYTRFATDAWWDSRIVVHAGDDLPPQRRPVLGGPGSLRGFRAASFEGRRRAVQGSTELRLPLPVPAWLGPVFLTWHAVGFADAGAVDGGDVHADVGGGISGINVLSYVGVFVAVPVTDRGIEEIGPRLVVRLRRDF